VWKLLRKLKLELPYDPTIPLLGIYSNECESGYNKDICAPTFIAELLAIAKIQKERRCPTIDEWIKKI
jgi:hypothetical protein